MENSWQRKCAGSGWQALQEQHQNQILNGNLHFHSSARSKPSSHIQRLAPETVNHWGPNLPSNNNMGLTELGSSFLSLISGPPCIIPNEVLMSGSHASVCATGSEVSHLSSGPFIDSMGGRHAQAGADLGWFGLSRARVNPDQGINSVPNAFVQGCQRDRQPLEVPKTDTQSKLSSIETPPNFSYSRMGYLGGATAPNVRKSHVGNTVGVSQRFLPKTDSSVSCQSSSLLTTGPRVFCLGLSGDLLLSCSVLGVVCLCHGLHMSIAKFAEHAGSCNVNPGIAVHVDGGETIAHWRKAYFHKIGIRIPEDHIGWDWPQGLPVTAGLLQHGPTLPKLSTDSDFYNQVSSFGASVHSVNHLNHILPPKNAQSGKNVNEFVSWEKPRSAMEDGSIIFKGLSSFTKNNTQFVADDHGIGYSRSGCSVMPSLIGVRNPYGVCPASSSCNDPICESGNSFLSNWQKLNVIGKDVAIGRSIGSLVEDTVSSNVELRLGQPSQQNQVVASGSSVTEVSGTHPIIHGLPRKSVFFDQQLRRTSALSSTEESRQRGFLAGIMPSSSVRTEKTESNDLNHVHGAFRVPDALQLKIFNKSASGCVTTSESFSNLRCPSEGKNCVDSPKEAINVNHAAILSKLHSGPSLAKTCKFGFPYLREKIADTEFCINMLDSQKHQKVEEVRRSAMDGLHDTAELNLETQVKSMPKWSSFGGIACDNGRMNYPVLRDKVSNMCQFTDTVANVPNKYFGQVSYPEHSGPHDPNSFKSINSPMESGTFLSSQALSRGNSATNSISMKSFVTSLHNDDAGMRPYLLDESSKLFSFQSMSALSDDILVAGASKTTPYQEESQNYFEKAHVIIPPNLSGTQKNALRFTNVADRSQVATCSLVSTNLTIEESKKLLSVTDTWHKVQAPVVSQGCYSHGKDVEGRFQFHSDLDQARQFFMRIGGNANVASSSEVGNCFQDSPHGCLLNECNFSRKFDCIPGRHDLLGNPSLGEFGEKEGRAVDLVAPVSGPKLSEIHTLSEKTDSFATKTVLQDMKKVEFNTFEWRDVPRKAAKDANEGDTNCHEKPAHHSSKDYEMSNLSSGCSAPAVTQVSIDANNKDSSTVDGVLADNLVLDEGSRIERCCSSDDDSEKSAEFYGFTSKFNLMDKCSSKASVCKPSQGLKDELQVRDSPKFRKLQSQTGTSFPIQTNGNILQNLESESRRGKRSTMKRKKIDLSGTASVLPAAHNETSTCGSDARPLFLAFKNLPMLSQGDQQSFTGCPSTVGENLKRISKMSSLDAVSQKRSLNLDIHEDKTDSQTNLITQNDYSVGEAVQRKRLRLIDDDEGLEQEKNSNYNVSEITAKGVAVDCNATSGELVNACDRRKPVVCGKYGVISNANSLKPAKIVSLRTLMKAARRCSTGEIGKPTFASVKESKKEISNAKKELKDGVSCVVSTELNSLHSGEGNEGSYFLGCNDSYGLSHTMKKRRNDGKRSHTIPDIEINAHLRPKYKQIRIRSINELSVKGGDPNFLKHAILKNGTSMQSIKCRFVPDANDGRMCADEKCNFDKHAKWRSCKKSEDSEASCCVCGSSDTDDSNYLLECNYCFIKVHQACYGVSTVPKALWYCRPCKTSCKNIVCVLCGYGGGAMTRALRTRNVVKSLLKAWGIVTESHSKNQGFSEPLGNSYKMLPSTESTSENDLFLIIRPAQVESNSVDLLDTDISNHVDGVDIPSSAPAALVGNSITAGVFDSTVKQWVHMVCGLWTPGTRCPNVDTMSAFDVSGVYQPKQDVVCTICQRSGGTCIQCRVADCHVQFHPWCAHQKGLLQSEVEGFDNQSVGFYGRCMLHGMRQSFGSENNHTRTVDHEERESTCARTEGYKGRKRDGFYDNRGHNSDAGSGCLVPQEQLNAWIHINGQKSSIRGTQKLPSSVVEYDCRKEYARYKQSRGWKHLVVYKSGIHGLGLYTSQFISRGAMVVEYVGEIVGAHVADKRETEYQAGKKLQYKSACYFFRIDKEHIIDATRKGGIARFVNHSCEPNCVAKVISVRNEKKVVFFAERDIYPGEEVTYDYHFNHEDEGKKLPCYCKAKSCRLYLN